MTRACIAVVDASRARIFVSGADPDAPDGAALTELRDLVHPERRQRPSELFSETRPGTSRTGGLQYTFDDHRDAHIEALDEAFAHAVLEEAWAVVRATHARRLILCASPHMLGVLRSEQGRRSDGDAASGCEIDELARDLVKLTPPQLRAYLASRGLLPAPPRRALR